jgi:hypothetical protein
VVWAVCEVLQHKVAAWPAGTVLQLLDCCGRLRVRHDGLVQVRMGGRVVEAAAVVMFVP